jgi:hypothetical protein
MDNTQDGMSQPPPGNGSDNGAGQGVEQDAANDTGQTGAFGATESDAVKARRGRPPQAAVLLGAIRGTDLYKAIGSDDCYADVVENDVRRTLDIRQSAFREFLTLKSLGVNGGQAMSRPAIDTVIDTCAGRAASAEPRNVYLRFAPHGREAWIDLGDDTWSAIRVTPQGWVVVQSLDVPVRFRRTPGMLPLPIPTPVVDPRASLLKLKDVVHLDDDDLLMLATGLCMAMTGRGPIVILVFVGPPGAAKTSAMRLARRLIDPANALHTRKSDKVENFMVTALNNAILCVDNVSSINDDISDALCGIATGQGEESREFYRKKQLSSFYVRRPVMMTGVGGFVTRGDLMDRSMLLQVAAIDENERKEEVEIEAAFNAIHSEVLGALLDGACSGLAGAPRPAALPRMADYYHWCVGAALAFAAPGEFENVYRRKMNDAYRQFISDDLVADAVVTLFDVARPSGTGTTKAQIRMGSGSECTIEGRATFKFDCAGDLTLWQGKAEDLLNTLQLVKYGQESPPRMGWPVLARALSVRLDHCATALASCNIKVKKRPLSNGQTGIELSR